MGGGPPKPSKDGKVHSDSGGVKVMAIQGRMAHERERVAGMSDAERAWRRQWLQDQKLTSREPMLINKESPEMMNPIRRFYRWPLNQVRSALTPLIGPFPAYVARYFIGKAMLGLGITWSICYWVNYHENSWLSHSGVMITYSRDTVLPGQEGFPAGPTKEPRDYFDRGFKDSIFGKKYDNSRPFPPMDDIKIDFS